MAKTKKAVAKKAVSKKATILNPIPGPCQMACTKTVRFYTDKSIPPNVGISSGVYTATDGYRFINIFVEFSQVAAGEQPVTIGTIFGFDTAGKLGARAYVNLEDNVPSPQKLNFISVDGQGTWHGSPHNKSSYCVRIPVMGPYIQVFVYNTDSSERKVSVWGYLTS